MLKLLNQIIFFLQFLNNKLIQIFKYPIIHINNNCPTINIIIRNIILIQIQIYFHLKMMKMQNYFNLLDLNLTKEEKANQMTINLIKI